MEKIFFSILILLLFQVVFDFLITVEADSDRPNIILIMVDDLGYGELGSYGQKLIKTPQLDKMAEEGMRFTEHYAGSTVCAPARDAIMTGRHTGNTFIRGNFPLHHLDGVADLPLPENTKTIANHMGDAGYQTALIGKWGLGTTPNSAHGFDYSLAYHTQLEAHDYYPPYLWENEKKFPLPGNENEGEEVYTHHLFADKTIKFIKNSDEEQPFFLYLPYTIPHAPFNPPNDAPYSDKEWPQQKKNIAAMITLLDRDIGRILDALREKGIAENTVVFFTSDNGPTAAANRYFNSNGSFRGIKRDLYEGGIRVPMIAWWPGTIGAGQVSNHASAAWDFLPTIMDIADLKPPVQSDGVSFLPELLGESQPQHEFLYWEFYNYNWNWDPDDGQSLPRNWLQSKAVRYGKWKAIKNNIHEDQDTSFELYNLELDPGEETDLANEFPEIIRKIEDYVTRCCTTSPYYPYTHQP